jgi:hypothetical protein
MVQLLPVVAASLLGFWILLLSRQKCASRSKERKKGERQRKKMRSKT